MIKSTILTCIATIILTTINAPQALANQFQALDESPPERDPKLLNHFLGTSETESSFEINHCPIGYSNLNSFETSSMESDLLTAKEVARARRSIERKRIVFFPVELKSTMQNVLDHLANKDLSISSDAGRYAVYFTPSAAGSKIFDKYLQILEALTIVYVRTERFQNADKLLDEMKSLFESVQDQLAIARLNDYRGDIFRQRGKTDEAEKFYRKALEIRRLILAENDPQFAISFNRLGMLMYDEFRPGDAQRYFQKARDVLSKNSLSTDGCPACAEIPTEAKFPSWQKMQGLAHVVIQDRKMDDAESKAEVDGLKALILSELPSNIGGTALRQYLLNQREQAQTSYEADNRKRSIAFIDRLYEEYVKRLKQNIEATNRAAQQVAQEFANQRQRDREQSIRESQADRAASQENSIRSAEQAELSSLQSRQQSVTGTSYWSRY
jgi:tetratricopeptide (TPR) repeat protein